MRWLTSLSLVLVIFLAGCQTIAPTPIQIGTLVDKNNEVVALYMDCTEGANFAPEQEGCDRLLLEEKVLDTLSFAKVFISGDIKQPQGYDIYLSTVMVYFRIGQRNTDEYSDAEKIARQFFESQKASSGKALAAARFYWAAICSAHAAWQWNYDERALTSLGVVDKEVDRKSELEACLSAARLGLTDTEWLKGPYRIRLVQYIQVLEVITGSIE